MTGPATLYPGTPRPAPPPQPGPMCAAKLAQIIRRANHACAREIEWHRKSGGDEHAVNWLATQIDVALPNFRRAMDR